MRDVEFLTLLVHRGALAREKAQALLPRLEDGQALDALLESEVGWSSAEIARLRRTRAGERPEIPGLEMGRKLGTGGTADVFLARDLKTRRHLAIKVLHATAARDEPTLRAFVNEARLLETLSNPGLVKGYGVARSGSTYFARMEHVDGATLLEHLDGGRTFSEDEALEIVIGVAETLRYLDQVGVVHRDVKPGNIMLTPANRVVLIDLGFAASEGAAAEGDSAVGTRAYLSPEQALGGASADIRSDIYSLGISLFHILVGRLPFESSDDREVLRMQVMDSLSSPELKGRSVSPHVQYFIEKMVAKDADERYQSWRELIEDVQAQLAGRDDLDFRGGGRS